MFCISVSGSWSHQRLIVELRSSSVNNKLGKGMDFLVV